MTAGLESISETYANARCRANTGKSQNIARHRVCWDGGTDFGSHAHRSGRTDIQPTRLLTPPGNVELNHFDLLLVPEFGGDIRDLVPDRASLVVRKFGFVVIGATDPLAKPLDDGVGAVCEIRKR